MGVRLTWLGHSCFVLKASDGTRVVMDPYDPTVGTLPGDLAAEIVTVSHQHFDHNYLKGVRGRYSLVDTAGHRKIGEIAINGIMSWHDDQMGAKRGSNIINIFEVDGLRICHLGDLGDVPSKDELLRMGNLDYLLIPVGGTYTLDPAGADRLIKLIRPRVAVPMHYGMKPGIERLLPLSAFLEGKERITYAEPGEVELKKPAAAEGTSYLVMSPKPQV
ncbi:MAG TPA: MBL fold metallo-hydrolase [Bacillota bacterium]|nr:MBL fold metallo-hydrolase [Bacillota bacterium]HOG53303.1 MBL fold metallo-hydrolase [Bacillota bacterium]